MNFYNILNWIQNLNSIVYLLASGVATIVGMIIYFFIAYKLVVFTSLELVNGSAL
jgi:hypothetical protein